MDFQSILGETPPLTEKGADAGSSDFLVDLNLDQIVGAIAGDRGDVRRLLLEPLTSVEAIRFRQEVMIDLEHRQVRKIIDAFAEDMRRMRTCLALSESIFHAPQKQRWFLDAIRAYGRATETLAGELANAPLRASLLIAFRDHLSSYLASEDFKTLRDAAENLEAGLSSIRYSLLIRDNRITVRRYADEADLGADLSSLFGGFGLGHAGEAVARTTSARAEMSQLEARILDRVARLFPEVFTALERFCAPGPSCLDERILTFEREVGFYTACLDFIAPFRQAGLRFCYPVLSAGDKTIAVQDAFDLALAVKLPDPSRIVRNDIALRDNERIFVVTGPNQGGKTTFARTFGQLHYLARLGCPVPGTSAQLFLCDRLLTHFEKEESAEAGSGKLEDDLVRIRRILQQATAGSIVILNEIFSSTALKDARFLGEKILREIVRLDAVCVYVTFVDELSLLDGKIVSLVSQAIAGDDAARTFKIQRRPADGLAYAQSLARRHRLTAADIAERLQR